MGRMDIRTRELLDDNEEFARLFNMVLYNGRPEIKADSLQAVDSVSVLSSSKSLASRDDSVRRDLLRRVVIKRGVHAYYMLLGVENQSFIDYGMPLRVLHYDIIQYMLQKYATEGRKDGKGKPFTSVFGPDDRLEPIVTVVVYYGAKPWTGPKRLCEMFRRLPEELARSVRPYLPSFRIKVISARSSGRELDMLGVNLRAVLYYARSGWRLRNLRSLLKAHPDLRTVGVPAANVIYGFMNIRRQLDSDKKEVNMTTIADELREEGFAKGRRKGISEGRRKGISEGLRKGISEGRAEGKAEIVRNMHSSGMPISDIAKYTKMSRNTLRRIVSAHEECVLS